MKLVRAADLGGRPLIAGDGVVGADVERLMKIGDGAGRKQFALYIERQKKPRRIANATRLTLVLLARLIE